LYPVAKILQWRALYAAFTVICFGLESSALGNVTVKIPLL
jgi:hypothetical protein